MNVVGTLAAALVAATTGSDPARAFAHAADAGRDLSFLPVSQLSRPDLPNLQRLLAGTPLRSIGSGGMALPFLSDDQFVTYENSGQREVPQITGVHVEARSTFGGWVLTPQDADEETPTVDLFRPIREYHEDGLVIVLHRVRLDVDAADIEGLERALATVVADEEEHDTEEVDAHDCTDAIGIVDQALKQVCLPGDCPGNCEETKGPTVDGVATFACDCDGDE